MLQEICIYFTLDNMLQICLSFLQSFFSQFDRLFRSINIKNPQRFPVHTHLHGSHIYQVQRCPNRKGGWIETWMLSWVCSVAHTQPPFLYNENQYEWNQQHSCPPCWLVFSRIAHFRQPVAFKLSHKHEKIIVLYPTTLE